VRAAFSGFDFWHNALVPMTPVPRHQCLIYQGPSSRHFSALATIVRQKLRQSQRCLYLDSVPMVAKMRAALLAAGVDVGREIEETGLVLSSSQQHLIDERTFDVDRMIGLLEDALQKALLDGYAGLWAMGDMTWEFGPDRDFSKLVEYEWRLEEFLRSHTQIGGICQYHADTLPREALHSGLLTHRGLFISETLSMINPHYLPAENFPPEPTREPELDSFVTQLCKQEIPN